MSTVGFFDSGVGGLTVLEAARERLDAFRFHYLGDTVHCPYGDRPLEEVRGFALGAVDYLRDQGCDQVVMACNISSSVALEPARARFSDVRLHGLINEDLVRQVEATTRSGRVGVMATVGTVESGFYPERLGEAGLEVIQQPCSPLVPLIEAGHREGPLVEQTLEPLLDTLRGAGVDTVVLGCTHYPFLRPVIERQLGPEVSLVDPGRVMAERLARCVTPSNGSAVEGRYAVTGEAASLKDALYDSFNRPEASVRRLSVEEVFGS